MNGALYCSHAEVVGRLPRECLPGRRSGDGKGFLTGMNLECLWSLLLWFAKVGPGEGNRREVGEVGCRELSKE